MRNRLVVFAAAFVTGLHSAATAAGSSSPLPLLGPPPGQDGPRLGVFEEHRDIGTPSHPGDVAFDESSGRYTVTGGGGNMWFARDDFHLAWTEASGDVSLAAKARFLGEGADPHRKACLMIRQDLEPDSPYVGVALHGDGLTSLQFREVKGGDTREVQANVEAPDRRRLEWRGGYARMFLASGADAPIYSGAAIRIAFRPPFLVGIGVCAHDDQTTETAVFSGVELSTDLPAASGEPVLYSTLETQSIASTDRRVVHVTRGRIEAPNWLADGSTLIFNSEGGIFRLPVAGGTPGLIDTGFATRCNNDHGVSPDGTRLAISDQSQGRGQSLIYTLPIAGGTPDLVTPEGPSYWHGWSPDGATLAYCAERDGEYDIYTIPVTGGRETRLTTAPGLDDGPDFSPDGGFIYFNSERSGTMQIWRMRPDGGGQEQVTFDVFNDWFPHPSPDGRHLVFLSYEPDVDGHPADRDVTLRTMPLGGGEVDVLARLFGGQGTINVPCWSPDGSRIAFVSYQLIPED
ncbi:TolB family protein [Tautonia plasticadhaerens]|uniref:Translocation protein TolB n=1 Tax=Tautonia plasticadhaerens TaxID=2527974 RepID=A0A518HEW0_9BACT|nr:TolB family protein [Tautonia plasticadhaerens]QDV39383.1 translocation protein TolB [Tautonia plasticadhaerens]